MSINVSKLIPAGLVRALKQRWRLPEMDWRMKNLREAGFSPTHVIDIGAYKAGWAEVCKRHFPQAAILLLEPQEASIGVLNEFCETHTDCEYRHCLIGARREKVLFVEQASNSRVIQESERAYVDAPVEERETTTLLDIVRGTPFEKSTFLKLDIQGKELEVLTSAPELLNSPEVLVMEISVIRIGPVPVFLEVVSQMAEWGYRLYDILGLNYRPLDQALWQVDVVFVKNESPLVASTSWG